MSDLANNLPRNALDVQEVTWMYSPWANKYDWVVRVIHWDDVRGHAVGRYRTNQEAEAAAEELRQYIAIVKRLST